MYHANIRIVDLEDAMNAMVARQRWNAAMEDVTTDRTGHARCDAPRAIGHHGSVLPRFLRGTVVDARWVVLGLSLLGMGAGPGNTVGQCGELAKGWTAACSAASGLRLQPQTCMPGRLVVAADLGADGTLNVDITPDSPTAVAHGGGAAFAPVGSFANWPSESAARRGAVEALARCAERDPSLLARAEKDARANPAKSAASGSSWADSSRLVSRRSLMWIVGGLAAIVVLGGLIRSVIRPK